jgi:multidrug efflux system membrane fusion protein
MKPIRLMVILIIIPAIFSLMAGCGAEPREAPQGDAVPVRTAVVSRQRLAIPIYTSGKLFPGSMSQLSFKIGGIIGRLEVDEGDTVKRGQLLAALDLAEIEARHRQARNAWLKAQRDADRVKNLYRDRAATLEQLQDVETAYKVAEDNLKIAVFNLEHSRIHAPASGKILKRFAEAGEMIAAGSPLFLFGSTETRWVVKAGVSERDLVRVALNDEAVIQFDAYPGKSFAARVSEISQAIDPVSGTYGVELTLEGAGEQELKLAAGFVGKTRIEPSTRETYFVIPVDSIVEGEGNRGVIFTAKNNTAVKVNIEIAHLFPETAAVRSGLEGIPSVITSGAAYLRDGSPVQEIK